MGFGWNKYALVLATMAAAGTVGCGGSGGGGGFGSTVAPSTSGSSAANTTSSSVLGNGPRLTAVDFVDADNNQMISKGDKIALTFDRELAPITSALDPSKEFELAVNGDSFGANATIAQTASAQCSVVLGDRPILHVSEAFAIGKTAPGSASGLNVSVFASGALLGKDAGPVAAAAQTLDITGTLATGFRSAGSLAVARGAHAAVELDDGRVLIVGGVGAGSKPADTYVSEPELYDPITGTFTKITDLSGDKGKMLNGKVAVKAVKTSATKLQDGTVLICGGYGVEKRGLFGLGSEKVDTLDSAFIFDPATNTFSKVADMNWSRHSHSATLMSDGKVLIAGGYNDSFWSSDKTQAPFELYNPTTKKFEKAGSIFSRFKSKEPRMSHSATSIEGGSGVLLVGGSYYTGGGLFGLIKPKLKMTKGSEVVRGLSTDKAGDLAAPRLNHAAASVTPRNVLIAGGHHLETGSVAGLELYDTATAQWTSVGTLKQGRTGCEIAVDGTTALVIGGHDGTAESKLCEVWNADSKTLEATTYTMANARNSFSVTTLKDGRVLVIGGLSGSAKNLESLDGQAIAECELFIRQ